VLLAQVPLLGGSAPGGAVYDEGSLFGDGQGVVVTDDGEMAAWRGQGAGRFTGHGTAVSWRGAIYYQTNSVRLARLNGVAAVYEFETDENGKVAAQIYE
jgi:hypothetical protein